MKTAAYIAALFVLVVGSSDATAADAPANIAGATTVDAPALIDLVGAAPDLVILDNRKPADYNEGHIEGAIRLIDTDITGPESVAKVVPSTDTPVLFYCNGMKCGRAAKAVEKAVSYGYTKVYYYANGMDEWRAQGLPLVNE